MNRIIGLTGIVACVSLAACTSMGDAGQMHDTRMRMRTGVMTGQASPTNYGTMAATNPNMGDPMAPSKASLRANRRTTVRTAVVPSRTAGNTNTVVMENAPANPQPAATAGNKMAPTAQWRWNSGTRTGY